MKFLVTAGPTREPIDPVRFISNRSSGKMGYAIASAAIEQAHDVVLISGPVCLEPLAGAKLVRISSCDELYEAVQRAVINCDVLVMCAAAADYKAATIAPTKLKKKLERFSLELVPTGDILKSLSMPRDYFVVGFAAESTDLETNAREKLRHKNCDMLVANDVSDSSIGMDSEYNEVTVLFKTGATQKISRAHKKLLGRELVKIIAANVEKHFDKNFTRMNDSVT